ncbi:hypothetical protein Tco_0606236 [Tanacetum coccineum]
MKSYIDNLERLGHPVSLNLAVSLILVSLRKEYDSFVQNYNMHGMGKTVNELHAMLKLHEKSLPKKNAHALHAIRAGKELNVVTLLSKYSKKLQKSPMVALEPSLGVWWKRISKCPKICAYIIMMQVKVGKLYHQANALSWKHFDEKHPEFASDHRNIMVENGVTRAIEDGLNQIIAHINILDPSMDIKNEDKLLLWRLEMIF